VRDGRGRAENWFHAAFLASSHQAGRVVRCERWAAKRAESRPSAGAVERGEADMVRTRIYLTTKGAKPRSSERAESRVWNLRAFVNFVVKQ
jgi:hypothetical protein